MSIVTSVVSVSSVQVVVSFDVAMKDNYKLTAVANYEIVTSSPDAVTPVLTSVIPEEVDEPTYVYLLMSEMTNGVIYDVSVGDGPEDINGDPVDPLNNSGDCIGIGEAPTVLSVVSTGKNTIDVIFSESMTDNDDIRNSGNYSFDNELEVIRVLNFEDSIVNLQTTDQVEGLSYNVSVESSPKVLMGTEVVGYVEFDIRGTNGKQIFVKWGDDSR